jgi:copper chaperone CopZ
MSDTHLQLYIEGMTCDGCASSIEHALKRQQGVRLVKVNWWEKAAQVVFDDGETTPENILGNKVFRRQYSASVQTTSEGR